MRQEELSESSKHILIIIIVSGFTCFPIKKSHLQFITSSHLRLGDTSLLRPLAFRKHQRLITTIRLHTLPVDNAITIAISLRSNTLQYLLLQPPRTRCLYYVVHNYLIPLCHMAKAMFPFILFLRELSIVT